ncbi:cytochrome c-type biogenesis CcmF C-terminal domain-containing protein [Deferribacterales bacterium RsTz2092]|nr:cytochrome c biogenesis protein CcmF [Deferribacterales bacterium]
MGVVFLVLGLVVGIVAIVAFILAVRERNDSYYKVGSYALIAQAILITGAVLVLLFYLVSGNFNNVYVASYTDKALPLVYKATALWAGQAGSLLLWAWLAVIFTAFELYRLRDSDKSYNSYVFISGIFTTIFFLFLCRFVTDPFETLPFTARDGNGLNPLLQNFGMIIHPPLLYVGFVAFMLPFAHAFASLMVGDVSTFWIKMIRPWSLFAWVFLTAGIVLGAWWAYVELGWGGYWAWDAVENASLFPWLTGTALLHAAVLYEHKGHLKSWGYALALITFELTIFGTYLTRSGIMSDSVHAFGQSSLSNFFLAFIVITTLVFVALLFINRRQLDDTADFNFLSREGMFFVALLCFIALTVAILAYTMLPVISNLLLSVKITVESASYNFISIPFFVVLFLLAGLAPVMSYGETNTGKLGKAYIPVLIVSSVVVVVAFALGWTSMAGALLTLTSVSVLASFVRLAVIVKPFKNNRVLGAIIIHVGLAVMALGVTYSALYKYSEDVVVRLDDSFEFDRYTISVGQVRVEQQANYLSQTLPLTLTNKGKKIATLEPEHRTYIPSNKNKDAQTTSEVAYYSTIRGDVYVMLDGYDTERGLARLVVIFQPLVMWIWVGCIMMCIGGIVAMLHKTKNV